MPLAESSVLQPRSPSLKSPDDWPTFILRKANIVSRKTGQIASLLTAHKENPLQVTGRLVPIDEERLLPLIKVSDYTRKQILLSNITSYAFAEYDDGSYGFWAAGQAGWFELEDFRPEYKTTLEEMSVATSMLYFIADKMRRSRKTDFTRGEFDKHIQRLFKDVYILLQTFRPAPLSLRSVLCARSIPNTIHRYR